MPFVNHEMGCEWLGAHNAAPGLVRQELSPLRWLGHRRGHHSKVFGLKVGDDDKTIAPMVEVVLDVVGAWANDCRSRCGVAGGDEGNFGRHLARRLDHDPLIAAGEVYRDEEPLIEIFEHQCIGCLVGAHSMEPHLKRTHCFVGFHIEHPQCV